MIAEYWADWLGIELNHDKRVLPISATRHLGFFVDLDKKMIAVTGKHRVKIIKFFDKFLMIMREKGRLLVRTLQKTLGLQI